MFRSFTQCNLNVITSYLLVDPPMSPQPYISPSCIHNMMYVILLTLRNRYTKSSPPGYRWAFATCRCTPCTPHIPEALWNRTPCCCHFMSDSIHVSLSHPSPVGHWLGMDWKRLTLDLCVPSMSLSLSNGTSQHQPPSSTSPASPSRPPFQCHSRGAPRHHEHRAMLPFVVTVSHRLLTSALGILPLVWRKPVLFACSPYVLQGYRSHATGRNPSQVLRVYPSSCASCHRSCLLSLVLTLSHTR